MSAELPKDGEFGLRVQSYVYPADITDADFKAEFTKINEDPDVTGILMLRPLPKQICEKDIEGMIDPEKKKRIWTASLRSTSQRSSPEMTVDLLRVRRRRLLKC